MLCFFTRKSHFYGFKIDVMIISSLYVLVLKVWGAPLKIKILKIGFLHARKDQKVTLLNLLLSELVQHLQIPKIKLFRKSKLGKFRKLHASEKYPFYSRWSGHFGILLVKWIRFISGIGKHRFVQYCLIYCDKLFQYLCFLFSYHDFLP